MLRSRQAPGAVSRPKPSSSSPFTPQRPRSRPAVACGAAAGRRALLEGSAALLLLTAARPALADEPEVAAAAVAAAPEAAAAAPPAPRGGGPKVYLDVRLEGQKLGRITIELLPDAAPVGSQRFADLAVGKEGVGYRLARFDRVTDRYVRCEGVKSLSYTAEGESPIAGGDSTQALEAEMAASTLRHDSAGVVSLVIGEEKEREVTERLVAMGGKLVTVRNVAGEAPNGSAFAITVGPAPELDATNLVVGRVVGGEEVVAALAALPRSKPRDDWFDKPFFEAGKAIGDKRATVAEKGFNRPFKRVIVSAGGLL